MAEVNDNHELKRPNLSPRETGGTEGGSSENLIPLEEFVSVPLSTLALSISELRTYRQHLLDLGLFAELNLLDENIDQLNQCVAAAIAANTPACLAGKNISTVGARHAVPTHENPGGQP